MKFSDYSSILFLDAKSLCYNFNMQNIDVRIMIDNGIGLLHNWYKQLL